MPVVISSDLVLSQAIVGDQPNANNPLIGWRNLVTVGNVAADSEDPAAPAIELANPFTYRFWRSLTTAEQHVTVTHNAVDPIDYVAIAGHNFGSAHIPVSIDGYNALVMGNPDWFELVSDILLASDAPLLFRFPPQSLIGVRIRLQAGDVPPMAAVVYVGRLLVLQRRIYVGHKPALFNERSNIVTGRSERGHFLGRIVLGAHNESAIQQSNVTPEFYRSDVEPWRKAGVKQPFFFAWRPGDYPEEAAYVWGTNDMEVSNQLANGFMQFSLNLQGIVS